MTFLMGVRARLELARLAVTLDPGDPAFRSAERLGSLVWDFFDAGVDLVQLRTESAFDASNPDGGGLDSEGLAAAVETVRNAAYDHQGLVSLTDEVGLAAAVAIDVVHLDRSEVTARAAAASQHVWALVGRSCVSRAQVDAAIVDPDVDYFYVGGSGDNLIRYATRAAPPTANSAKPWFANGNITADNLDEALRAGARRVCLAFEPGPPWRAGSSAAAIAVAREFGIRIRRAWRTDPTVPELGGGQASAARPRFRRPGEPSSW